MYKFNVVTAEEHQLTQLLDRVEQSLDQGLLPVEVFCDDTVFRAEMDRIFTRAWVFVAHDSEIPKSGDYVLRKIGLDQVIVARDDEGKVNVMLNHCRHRGSQVCHEDTGNTRHFKCPYHGWIYNLKGEFSGAPHFADAYGAPLDKQAWGLKRAPKVESFHGFVFACLSDDVPPLKEYLGGMAWALETIVGLHPKGMVAIKPPERFTVRADWKSGAENFAGDAYHVSTGHLSAGLCDFIPDVRQVSTIARGYDFGNGNSFIGHELSQWGPDFEFWGYPKEMVEQFDFSGLDEVQVEMIKKAPPTVGTVFPNFSYLRFPQPATPGGRPFPFTSIRMWQPISPGVMELWNWQFEYAFADAATMQESYLAGVFGFGSGGIFEQDDTAVWEGVAKAANSPWNRKDGVQLHYQQKRRPADENWQGPGKYYDTIYGEYLQEEFWRRWLRDMRRSTPAPVCDAAVDCHGDHE